MACQRLGLCQEETERLIAHLEGLRESHLENRYKIIEIEENAVYAMLDGVAEDDRSKGRYCCIVVTVVSTHPSLNSICSVHF